MELPENEQIQEDKYQVMKHVKDWNEEEHDYALFTSQSNKKKPKKAFKGHCGYCGEFGHKAAECPNKKSNQNNGSKGKSDHKKKQSTKGDQKGKGHNCGEHGHYAHDYPKRCDNTNIAQESEQNKKVKNMLDSDNSCVNKECAMMCMEVQYEDGDEVLVVYGDQGVSTEEHDKDMYGKLMKTQSEEEEEVEYNVALRTNDSMSLEKKRRQLNETMPNENVHDVSQSDILLNENPARNTFNNEATTGQGPMGGDDVIELQKAWMMKMPMNDSNISMTTTSGPEQAHGDYKKFLYARVTHSNHAIQYHMQQIMERQWVVNEYRSMMVDGMDLTPLELNSYKSDPVIISHDRVDNFWHCKTFDTVLADLQRSHDKEIHEQENDALHCTENDKTNRKLDENEVINLCSESQTTTSEICKGEESRK